MTFFETVEDVASVWGWDRLVLTVHTPDCVRSRLVDAVDTQLLSRGSLRPVKRYRVSLPARTACELYSHACHGVAGALIQCVLSSGESFLTVWIHDGSFDRIRSLKGGAHPSAASTNSIRGSFACDNPISNLIHCSDNTSSTKREIRILSEATLMAFPPPLATAGVESHSSLLLESVQHSGIATLVKILLRMNRAAAEISVTKVPFAAHSAFLYLLGRAKELTAQTPHSLELLEAYQFSDLVAIDRLSKEAVASRWESLILRCGSSTYKQWTTLTLGSAVAALAHYLKDNRIHSWLFTAGVAMRNLGVPREPKDIDIRSTEAELENLAALFGKTISVAFGEGFHARSIIGTWGRWHFECLADLHFDDGRVASLTNGEISRAGTMQSHSTEDLIVEYASMARLSGGGDMLKINQVLASSHQALDGEYLSSRLFAGTVRRDIAEALQAQVCRAAALAPNHSTTHV